MVIIKSECDRLFPLASIVSGALSRAPSDMGTEAILKWTCSSWYESNSARADVLTHPTPSAEFCRDEMKIIPAQPALREYPTSLFTPQEPVPIAQGLHSPLLLLPTPKFYQMIPIVKKKNPTTPKTRDSTVNRDYVVKSGGCRVFMLQI